MKFYAFCKDCGYSIPNKEPGIYFCPQCKTEKFFYKLELFDGAKPGKLYDKC